VVNHTPAHRTSVPSTGSGWTVFHRYHSKRRGYNLAGHPRRDIYL